MASLKHEIKGARSVVVMILNNGPSDRSSIAREVRCFFKINLKLEVFASRRVDKEFIYSPKPKFDNDEFGITRVRYIEVQHSTVLLIQTKFISP